MIRERIRTFTLTNCDCEGNFPPPVFAPFVELARQDKLVESLAGLLPVDTATWAASPIGAAYENPERVPEEVWRGYTAQIAETPERARAFERAIAALDPAQMEAVGEQLRALNAPTLLVWGTGDATFAIKWAHHLPEIFPGAREVIEVDGAKIFFPEERPGDLVPHLRKHWGR